MNLHRQDWPDRASRDAERARALAHARAVEARDAQPLMAMVAASLCATAAILGIMWLNSPRYDGAISQPLAEQQERQ